MKLKNKNIGVGIYTADHEKLAKWYMDVLGFEEKERLYHPQDTYIEFKFGDNYFWIGKHDKIKPNTKNSDKYRVMVTFRVPRVTGAYEEIKDKNVTFIATPFEAPPGGFWCMTIEDLDGNIVQFMGDK